MKNRTCVSILNNKVTHSVVCLYDEQTLNLDMPKRRNMESEENMTVVIDGSIMEGGGQLVRMAVSLAAILSKKIQIVKIRAGRSKPGLRAQHVAGIKLVADIVGARVEQCHVGSTEVVFEPRSPLAAIPQNTDYTADAETAGAITLMAQIAQPVALFAQRPLRLELRGGTDSSFAPTFDFYDRVFRCNLLQRFSDSVPAFQCQVLQRGYFPKGGGVATIHTKPLPSGQALAPITLTEPGSIVSIDIDARAAGKDSAEVARRMADSARSRLVQSLENPGQVDVCVSSGPVMEPAFGTGSSILISAKTSSGCVLGASALGSARQAPESIGAQAVSDFLPSQSACTDQYIQDQLVVYMALADGRSRVLTGPATLHTKTAMHVAELLTSARFSVEESSDGANCIITCEGSGHRAP